jgi:beta-lactamase regulating signal transducer with metallopeptidase domain
MAAFFWLLGLIVRSTVVLSVALLLDMSLRRTSAAARHRLLTFTAFALLLLPALSGLLPRWEIAGVPLWAVTPIAATQPAAARTTARPTPAARTMVTRSAVSPGPAHQLFAAGPGAVTPRPAHSFEQRSANSEQRTAIRSGTIATAAVAVWLLGIVISLGALARALRRERHWLAASHPLDGTWLETLADVCRSLAVSRPVRLLASDDVDTPMTGGWPAAVLLPATAEEWSGDRRQVVLQHELVHVAHGDTLRQLAWRLVAALYWFHPLARLAQQRAKLAGEQACDEAVLRLGTRPSTYARHLLEIAESLRAQPPEFAGALPMIDRTQLERRLLMILDPKGPAGHGRMAAILSIALLALTVLAVGVAAPPPPPVPPAPPELSAPSVPSAPPPPPALAAPSVPSAPPALAELSAPPVPSAPPAPPAPRERHATRTFVDGDSEFDQNDDDGTFMMGRDLGAGRRFTVHVSGPVHFGERGAILDLGPSASVSVETRGRRGTQRMLITSDGGKLRYQWAVDGATHAVDDDARAWLADALEVAADSRAIGTIQGQVGSLQGQIGSIQGEIGSLQGRIGSIQGEIGSLQGKVGSIQGDEGSLQGEIGSHEGAIGGLEAARGQASSALQKQIDSEIREHEAAIEKLKAELHSGKLARRKQAAQEELKTAEAGAQERIAAVKREMADVHAEERIEKLHRQIEEIHAHQRIQELERQMEPALERLKGRIDR